MNAEAQQSTSWIDFLAWLEVNKKRLIIFAVVVGLVASVGAVWRYFHLGALRAADQALLRLGVAARGSDAASSEDYLRIASEHAGTPAAARARLLAAEALFRSGRYAEAQSEFQTASSLLRDDGLKAASAYGRAVCLEALGRTDEAVSAYQEVALQYGLSGVAVQARLALAGLYEARGDKVQALRTYDELGGVSGSVWQSEVMARREALLARNPDLARSTNAAPLVLPAGAPGSSPSDSVNVSPGAGGS